MNAKQLAKQQTWSARRRTALEAKRGRTAPSVHPDDDDDMPVSAPPQPSAEPMLAVQDREPDDTDPAALLDEIAERDPDALPCARALLDGLDPEIYAPAIPREYLGRVAVAMWRRGDRPAVVRAMVEWAWGGGTPHIIRAAGRDLFTLLRYCAFPLPSDLPETVTVWRAARGVTVEQARRGLSWTLDRDAACGFLRVLELKFGVSGKPLVIRREVPRSAIVMHTILGELDEVIFDAPPAGEVDGNSTDWTQASRRWALRLARTTDEGRALMAVGAEAGLLAGPGVAGPW